MGTMLATRTEYSPARVQRFFSNNRVPHVDGHFLFRNALEAVDTADQTQTVSVAHFSSTVPNGQFNDRQPLVLPSFFGAPCHVHVLAIIKSQIHS